MRFKSKSRGGNQSLQSKKLLSESDFSEIKRQLKDSGKLFFPIASDSMKPIINSGEIIEVVSLKKEIDIFDILVIYQNGMLICHYVFHMNNRFSPDGLTTISTRGLNSRGEDFPITKDMILGIVSSHKISNWKKIQIWLSKILSR